MATPSNKVTQTEAGAVEALRVRVLVLMAESFVPALDAAYVMPSVLAWAAPGWFVHVSADTVALVGTLFFAVQAAASVVLASLYDRHVYQTAGLKVAATVGGRGRSTDGSSSSWRDRRLRTTRARWSSWWSRTRCAQSAPRA
ncbi:uncharacterized protein V1510DRAFT_418446 [Dipodascopsis tothii]|uniref:uncharacterized protein n=1 Tax=Dipodascopsis tothii TaxID=44089 RepID=UPI0034CD81CF